MLLEDTRLVDVVWRPGSEVLPLVVLKGVLVGSVTTVIVVV